MLHLPNRCRLFSSQRGHSVPVRTTATRSAEAEKLAANAPHRPGLSRLQGSRRPSCTGRMMSCFGPKQHKFAITITDVPFGAAGRESLAPELIERLWLYGNDGAKYWAHIFEERINASALSPGSWISGERTCLLEGGTPLKRIDETTFKNPETGAVLSRNPPKVAE